MVGQYAGSTVWLLSFHCERLTQLYRMVRTPSPQGLEHSERDSSQLEGKRDGYFIENVKTKGNDLSNA